MRVSDPWYHPLAAGVGPKRQTPQLRWPGFLPGSRVVVARAYGDPQRAHRNAWPMLRLRRPTRRVAAILRSFRARRLALPMSEAVDEEAVRQGCSALFAQEAPHR